MAYVYEGRPATPPLGNPDDFVAAEYAQAEGYEYNGYNNYNQYGVAHEATPVPGYPLRMAPPAPVMYEQYSPGVMGSPYAVAPRVLAYPLDVVGKPKNFWMLAIITCISGGFGTILLLTSCFNFFARAGVCFGMGLGMLLYAIVLFAIFGANSASCVDNGKNYNINYDGTDVTNLSPFLRDREGWACFDDYVWVFPAIMVLTSCCFLWYGFKLRKEAKAKYVASHIAAYGYAPVRGGAVGRVMQQARHYPGSVVGSPVSSPPRTVM